MIAQATKRCQACAALLTRSLIDLDLMPLANALLSDRTAPEARYPLHARVCEACWLVQIDQSATPAEIFSDYSYLSSYSATWRAHCGRLAEMSIARFALAAASQVIEIGSNDGCLGSEFLARGVAVLGVEPSINVSAIARSKGIATETAFFGRETASRLLAAGHAADLIVATNVLAHVPDINDFIAGVEILLKPGGVFVAEFPHLLNLIQQCQFDTIYHEHATYLSLLSLEPVLNRHGLEPFDVEMLPTHGGSLRLFAGKSGVHPASARIAATTAAERAADLDRGEGYDRLEIDAKRIRGEFREFVRRAMARGERIAAFGAAAKGVTFLNYCGITAESIDFVTDANPIKQGKFLPGSRIPIRAPEAIGSARPDWIIILPWNLKEEITAQLDYTRQWGGRLVTAIPELKVD